MYFGVHDVLVQNIEYIWTHVSNNLYIIGMSMEPHALGRWKCNEFYRKVHQNCIFRWMDSVMVVKTIIWSRGPFANDSTSMSWGLVVARAHSPASDSINTTKKRHCLKLTDWRPITSLNTIYKISPKALQKRLQPLLVEVIDSNQTIILPFEFILDNILLTHKSIQWTQESCQNSFFCKLDFNKA